MTERDWVGVDVVVVHAIADASATIMVAGATVASAARLLLLSPPLVILPCRCGCYGNATSINTRR